MSFFMTAGPVSDYTGAAALLDDMPKAQWLLGDRGYDADWFRDALEEKGVKACIPGRKSRSVPIKYDKRRYRGRSRIEVMFGRLKPVLSNCVQAERYSVLFLTMALRVMSSLRMVATMASLNGLPAARSRLAVAARGPLPERAMARAAR